MDSIDHVPNTLWAWCTVKGETTMTRVWTWQNPSCLRFLGCCSQCIDLGNCMITSIELCSFIVVSIIFWPGLFVFAVTEDIEKCNDSYSLQFWQMWLNAMVWGWFYTSTPQRQSWPDLFLQCQCQAPYYWAIGDGSNWLFHCFKSSSSSISMPVVLRRCALT